MRACVFPECRRRPSLKHGRNVSYHRFPRETSIAYEWVNWIRDVCGVDFRLALSSSLCSRQFTEDCFRPSGRLKPDIFPTLIPDDLDKAEKDSNGKGIADVVNHDTEEKQLRNSPNTAEHMSNLGQPEVLFMKHQELTDGVIKVPGCGGVSSEALKTKTEKKISSDSRVDHLRTFQRLQQSVKILSSALNKIKHRLHTQTNKVRRVEKTVSSIKISARILRKEGKITDEGQSELILAIDRILNHMNYKKVVEPKHTT